MRRKRMHGRRRRRSPLHSNGTGGQIGEHNGKPVFKTAEEAFEWHKKNANDESSGGAINKNATTASGEASEKAAVGETAKVGTDSTESHDTTHSHPPAAIEGKKEAEEEGMSPREQVRNKARSSMQNMMGGSWGSRTFGW